MHLKKPCLRYVGNVTKITAIRCNELEILLGWSNLAFCNVLHVYESVRAIHIYRVYRLNDNALRVLPLLFSDFHALYCLIVFEYN